jgi:hypothetical protein
MLWNVDPLLGDDSKIANIRCQVTAPQNKYASNATIALKKRNGVFYAVSVEVLQAGQVRSRS